MVGWLGVGTGNSDEQLCMTKSKGGEMEGPGEVPYLKARHGVPSEAATARWWLGMMATTLGLHEE